MGTKRIHIEGCSPDRFSSLPVEVTEHILARIPTRDAARTSILSRKWRYIWAQHPHLVLNRQFCRDIWGNRPSIQFLQYHVSVVNQILFQHHGPILNFLLQVPPLPVQGYSIIDEWLLFLSRQGLQELILDITNPVPYSVPSSIVSCPTLTKLYMTRCMLKTVSTAMEAFKMLTDLRLFEVTFEPSFVLITAPKLSTLILLKCQGTRHFRISAPNLNRLYFVENDDFDLSHYISCSNLEIVDILALKGEHHIQERINLTKLLGSWSVLKSLYLDADYLKYVVAGNIIPERLPTESLKALTHPVMLRFAYSLDMIACILCLLRSSINLHKLAISADKIVHIDMEAANFLE